MNMVLNCHVCTHTSSSDQTTVLRVCGMETCQISVIRPLNVVHMKSSTTKLRTVGSPFAFTELPD